MRLLILCRWHSTEGCDAHLCHCLQFFASQRQRMPNHNLGQIGWNTTVLTPCYCLIAVYRMNNQQHYYAPIEAPPLTVPRPGVVSFATLFNIQTMDSTNLSLCCSSLALWAQSCQCCNQHQHQGNQKPCGTGGGKMLLDCSHGWNFGMLTFVPLPILVGWWSCHHPPKAGWNLFHWQLWISCQAPG